MRELPSFASGALSRAAQALLQSVANRSGIILGDKLDRGELVARLRDQALECGYFVDEVELFEDDIPVLLAGGRPFLFASVPDDGHVLVATEFTKRTVTLVGPLGAPVPVDRKVLEGRLRGRRDARTQRLAHQLGGGRGGEDRIAAVLTAELAKAAPVGWGYVLRPNDTATVADAVGSLRLGRRGAEVLGLSVLQTVLATGAWAVIGSVAIAGHADVSNLLGWALLSITSAIMQVVATRVVGRFTVRAATVLRGRLLEGALKLEPESLSNLGLGGLMVLGTQADSFSSSVLALSIAALGALTNLVATAAVLSIAPLPWLMLGAFAVFVLAVTASTPRVLRLHHELQTERVRTTTDMVERMLGHSTRLVQQTPKTWHDGEDEGLIRYAHVCERLDKLTVLLRTAPRAYYIASIVALFLILVSQPTQLALALSIGGMTLGMSALGALVNVVLSSGGVYSLLRAIGPVIADGEASKPGADLHVEGVDESRALVELRNVGFRYPTRAKAVLEEVDLRIAHGDRMLVEGPSGGGKTTLATIMTGIRRPDTGLVLIGGLDQHSIREGELRRLVATAPQFYRNHVFTGSLAFNLLLGRAWPPEPADLAAAAHVAGALGLGPLLDRMPSGLFQQVGDTGWQLSHGEKSRVYLARALLQRSKVLVLDETFGGLDPASLRQCMAFVLQQGKAVVVITHR